MWNEQAGEEEDRADIPELRLVAIQVQKWIIGCRDGIGSLPPGGGPFLQGLSRHHGMRRHNDRRVRLLLRGHR